MNAPVCAVATVLALVCTCESAYGQIGRLDLDLGASYALPPGGGLGEANEYLNAGLRLSGQYSDIGYGHIGGYGGLSLSQSGSSWVAFVASGRILAPISQLLSVGFSLTGEAFRVGDPFPYTAAMIRAEPELAIGRGNTVLSLRGYGGVGTSEVTVLQTFIRDSRHGPVTVSVGLDVPSDLWAWGGGLELRHRVGALLPSVSGQAYQAPQGTYAGGTAGLAFRFGGGVITVEGGVWDTPDGTDGVLVAGLELFVGDGGSAVASGGRYGPDPLLDVPVVGAASAGVTTTLVSFTPKSEVSQQIYTVGDTRFVRLVLRSPDAAAVSVTGDFTDWSEVPMTRDGELWVVELAVESGAHHYGFLVDGAWHVPADAPGRAEDEWGGMHATLMVAPTDAESEM